MAAMMNVKSIKSMDITAAFLQADNIKREIFINQPKDLREDGLLWKLKKPLYGLNDAGRKFWIRVKKILKLEEFESVKGDEAFYIKKKGDKLIGMLLLHVDDFLMAGDNEFIEETVKMFEDNLTISKVEKDSFRFIGVDLKVLEDKIELSMEDYATSLEEIQ